MDKKITQEKRASEKLYEDDIWQEIFHCSEKEFEKLKKQYSDYFSDLDEKDYKDISSCIENAKKSKNHLAFAHYFLEKCVCEEILFKELFRKYIERVTYNYKAETKENWFGKKSSRIYIFKGNFFRDKDYSVNNGNAEEDILNLNGEGLVDIQNLGKWYSGENCPKDRYEIIQCAFYLYLTVEETNDLLNLAGLQSLYPVNVIDYHCVIALNQCSNKEKVLDEKKTLDIFCRHIIPLKEKINDVLGIYEEIEDKVNKFIPVKKGKKKGIASFAYSGGMFPAEKIKGKKTESMSFEEVIRGIKRETDELTGKSGEQYRAETELWMKRHGKGKMTELYSSRATEQKAMDGEYLKKSTIGYYGLQYQIFNAVMQFEKYEKNLFNYDGSLTFEEELGMRDIGNLNENSICRQENCISNGCWKIWQKHKGEKEAYQDKEKMTDTGISDTEKRKVLEYIWQYPKSLETGKAIFTSVTPLYHLLYGRFNKVGNEYYYEPDFTRKSMIQFCLACGQEDNIDKFLKLACFLECGIKNMKTKKKQKKENLVKQEKISAFVQYAIAYRDELIRHWNEKGNYNSIQVMEQRNSFPMIQLFRDINRDIQFVVGYIYGCYRMLGLPVLKLKNLRDSLNEIKESNTENHFESEKKMQEINEKMEKVKNQIDAGKITVQINHGLESLELRKLYKLEKDTTIYIYPVM